MSLDDTIVGIGKRLQKLGTDGYLFYRTSKPGISLREEERYLREFMQDHPARKYLLLGLGNTNSLNKLTSTPRFMYNGITSIMASLTDSPSLLRLTGVNIEKPPKELSKEERKDLRVSIPAAMFDFIFPELISVGYGTKFGNRTGIVSHLDNGDYWTIGEVDIGRNVFVGANSVITPGVKVGDYAKINMSSVVVTDVPAGTVYGGNPAAKIADRYIREVELVDGTPKVVRRKLGD